MNSNLLRNLYLCFLLVSLVSCGYHLRGNTQLSPQSLPVYLFSNDSFHDLRRELASQLRRSHISTTAKKSLASTVITIESVEKNNKVISVDTKGRTSEYELNTMVKFSIYVNTKLLKKKIRVSKDVAFNPSNILAFKKEEKILYDEMLVEVSRLMLLQLRAITDNAF